MPATNFSRIQSGVVESTSAPRASNFSRRQTEGTGSRVSCNRACAA